MSTPNRHTPGPWRVSEVSCDVLAPSAAKDAAGEPNYWRIIAEVPALGPPLRPPLGPLLGTLFGPARTGA